MFFPGIYLEICAAKCMNFQPRYSRALRCFSATSSPCSSLVESPKLEYYNFKEPGDGSIQVSKDEALKMYTKMATIRRLETVAGELYKSKIIRGFCHLYSGQEAVAVGIHSVMKKGDAIITSYRAHGWCYLMGIDPYGVLAELAGKKDGCSAGKGGSMHMYGTDFYGGNGIVGAQVPLGVGVALAAKYKKTDNVCITLYGDGASNQGQVFEAFNIAKLLQIPAVLVCENNRYGMGTSAKRSSANSKYYTRGDYIPGIQVDGMDILAVYKAAKIAIEYSRTNGPILLEALTYRYFGHSMSDPGTSYRTKEEVAEMRKTRDPIQGLKQKMINAKMVTEDELKNIENKLKKELNSVSEKAKSATEPSVQDLSADIYCSSKEAIIRNTTPFNPLPHLTLVKRCVPAPKFEELKLPGIGKKK